MAVIEDENGGLRCTKCGETKPLHQFRKHSPAKSGVKQPCKSCDNERGRVRQEIRRKRGGYAEYINQKVKDWRKRNPKKYQAQVTARIYKKRLKSKYCERCLSEKDLHMHHPDYNKPLEVITLCRDCHEAVHHG